jgi:hypothetical protein
MTFQDIGLSTWDNMYTNPGLYLQRSSQLADTGDDGSVILKFIVNKVVCMD